MECCNCEANHTAIQFYWRPIGINVPRDYGVDVHIICFRQGYINIGCRVQVYGAPKNMVGLDFVHPTIL